MSEVKKEIKKIVICDDKHKFIPDAIELAKKEVFGEECDIQVYLYLYIKKDNKFVLYKINNCEWEMEWELNDQEEYIQDFSDFVLKDAETLICLDFQWDDFPNFKEKVITSLEQHNNYIKDKVKIIIYTTNSPGDADNYVMENKQKSIFLDSNYAFQMTTTLTKQEDLWESIFEEAKDKF